MSAHASRLDAIAPNAALGLDDVSEKPSFFFTVPARNPRTLCCCQSLASIISSMLAPSGWLSRVSTRSCLVTRATFDERQAELFAHNPGQEATDRVGLPAGCLHDGGNGCALFPMEHREHLSLL